MKTLLLAAGLVLGGVTFAAAEGIYSDDYADVGTVSEYADRAAAFAACVDLPTQLEIFNSMGGNSGSDFSKEMGWSVIEAMMPELRGITIRDFTQNYERVVSDTIDQLDPNRPEFNPEPSRDEIEALAEIIARVAVVVICEDMSDFGPVDMDKGTKFIVNNFPLY